MCGGPWSSYVEVVWSRGRSLLRGFTPLLAALAAATPARADELPEPPEPPQPPPAAVVPASPQPRDYDAPDPDRSAVTYLRAAASVSFLNYLIWQYDWIKNDEPICLVTGDDIFANHIGGYARLWYEVEAIRDLLGVGMAPKLTSRIGRYTRGRTDDATQLSLELYATVRL